MKIKLNQELKTFNGFPLKDGEETLTLGQAISSILLNSKGGGKMKLFILAQKCYKGGTIDVDKADMTLIQNEVKTSQLPPIIAGQVEMILADIKEEK